MFEKGNKLWQLADPTKVGRKPIFKNETELWNESAKSLEYELTAIFKFGLTPKA